MKVTEDEMNDMFNKCMEAYKASIGKKFPLPDIILKPIIVSGILAGLHHATGEPTELVMNDRKGGANG